MAVAMLLPLVRRSVPRWIEAFIWIGLIASSWLTIRNVRENNSRFLTDSLTWGVGQIVNTSIELLTASLKGWLAVHQYEIAETVVVIVTLDAFLLAALELRRRATKSLPRVRLGGWFEFRLAEPEPIDIRKRAREKSIARAGRGGQSPATAPVLIDSAVDDESSRLAS